MPRGEVLPFTASHLGLRWSGDDEDVVELRWMTASGWQPWVEAPIAHDLEDAAAGLIYSGIIGADGAERVETRAGAGSPTGIEVTAIDADAPPVRSSVAPTTAVRSAVPAEIPTPGRVPQPAIVTRAEWGANEALRGREAPLFAPVTKLVVHHTVTPNDDPDPAATMRAMYAFHTQVRGFNDIGYNFLIDAAGRVYEGRYSRAYGPDERPTGDDADKRGVIGAHAEGANTGSVGIALLGDFTSARPAAAALAGLESMLAWGADRYGIDPLASAPYVRAGDGSVATFANISGHRDTRATECPGDLLYAGLPGIRQSVASAIAASRVVTPGYWVASRDGQVQAFGEAPALGDVAGRALNSPVRAMAPTPAGKGYWLLTGDGGMFSFGDAAFFGSTGAIKLNQPVVGMAPTPSGQGYWLVASDGGIFAFGDASFRGSTGAIKLNQPIVGMTPAPDGRGYWMVARDGGLFAFNVAFAGSVPGLKLPAYAGSAAMRATPTGRGYYILGSDGGIFAFGDAKFHGARSGLSGEGVAVDLSLVTPGR